MLSLNGAFHQPAYGTSVLPKSPTRALAGWVCPTLAADRLLAKRVPVYSFEFADEHPPAPDLRPDFPLGAYHSSELPYLFGMGDVRLHAGQARLSTRMIAAWTTFARTGAPGGTWQPFPRTLQLTPAGDRVVNAATDHRCAFWTQIDQTPRRIP
ncbi:hypothetical protein GCM10027569_52590 [Flindersiella endophytica]